MKSIKWIQGTSPAQHNSKGEEMSGLATFYHIKKPRTKGTALCGVPFDPKHGVIELSDKRAKETASSEFCHECRFRAGLSDRFGKMLEGGKVSRREVLRARTRNLARSGQTV